MEKMGHLFRKLHPFLLLRKGMHENLTVENSEAQSGDVYNLEMCTKCSSLIALLSNTSFLLKQISVKKTEEALLPTFSSEKKGLYCARASRSIFCNSRLYFRRLVHRGGWCR